eukprot:1762866-Prymnesium_polylepis.1
MPVSRGHGTVTCTRWACGPTHVQHSAQHCVSVCNADARDAALAWRWRAIAYVPSAHAWWARGDWQRTGS